MHGSTRLEIGWTVVPLLILVAISGYTFVKLPDVEGAPSGAQTVKVEAFSFGWRFTYPNGRTQESDTVTLPVGEPTRFEVTAPETDVQHNFWIPQLGPKIDTIPGQVNETWFEPTATGRFRGQCAEFCGVGHAQMLLFARVVSPEDYEKFLAGLERGDEGDGGGG
jgi:cytochrome c oxidase subunit 2